MSITNLLTQLQRDEGLRLFPYTDTVGKLTIGYGHNLIDKGITVETAQALLAADIEDAKRALAQETPIALLQIMDEIRYAVLVNMSFNIGAVGVAKFHTMIACLLKKDWEGAATAMLDSKWASQVGPRAQRLAQQMRTGQWQ